MALGSLLSIIVAALAILGAGGSAVAFLADRNNKSRLDGLRHDITDRNERIDFLEDENTRKDGTITAQSAEISTMHGELQSLKEYRDAQAGPLLTITEQIRQLHDLMRAHQDIAKASFATLETQNADILRLHGDRREVPPENITRAVSGGAP